MSLWKNLAQNLIAKDIEYTNLKMDSMSSR